MTAPLNGHDLSAKPDPIPEPKGVIAREVYALYAEEDDEPYDDLTDAQRDSLEAFAVAYISSHMKFLAQHGFRLLPPGAVLRPKSDEEAGAMEHAVKLYRQAATRKGGLVSAVAPGLILPKGAKLQ